MKRIAEYELNQTRVGIRFGNDEYDYMLRASDNAEAIASSDKRDHIFTKLFKEYCAFENYINGTAQKLDISQNEERNSLFFNTVKRYDKNFFADKSLVVMFSDERSGGNRISIDNVEAENGEVKIIMKRKRGLTMDMAYIFFFLELAASDLADCTSADAAILTDTESEATLF